MNNIGPNAMKKETIVLPDGRYLIYYRFEDSGKTANEAKVTQTKEKKHV